LHGLRDVEVAAVQFRHRAVLQVLHPLPELVDSLDGSLWVGLEQLDHRVESRAGQDALRGLRELPLDAA